MDSALANGLFVFVLGLLVVFFGMIIIILAVSLFGKILSAKDNKVQPPKTEPKVETAPAVAEDEVSEEVKAAIVAAITAYYFNAKSKPCDFVVKRIKRF